MTTTWQPMGASDLREVVDLADRIHVDLHEGLEVIAEKHRRFPAGCSKVVDDGRLVAYGIAHPWLLYRIPQLDAFLGDLPPNPDCLYIHDVVVAPEARGRDLAGACLERLKAVALRMDLHAMALVSVYGTTRLWSRFGFIEESPDPVRAKLASYGATARYMVCRL